jgi:hypothetical protein
MSKNHFDKILGSSENDIPKYEALIQQHSDSKGVEVLEDELEKTEHDAMLIKFTEDFVNRFLTHYGRKKIDPIALEKIHLIPANNSERNTYIPKLGSLVIERAISDLRFVLELFHELVHAKSLLVLQLDKEVNVEKESDFKVYRLGFVVISHKEKKIYFENLNEAVVSYLEREFYDLIKDNPLFSTEVSSEEIDFSRDEEVAEMDRLIDDLAEKNQEEFNKRDIRDLFIRAGINGTLLEIARLIEETYGKGAFRKIAEDSSGYTINVK